MAPLTSPSGCRRCLQLSQTIAKLEGRISVLHQLRDEEDFIDSLVKVGAAAADSAEAELDATIPLAAPEVPACLEAPTPPRAPSIPAAAPSIPGETKLQSTAQSSTGGGAGARWLREGAKPKEHKTATLGYFTPNPKIQSSTPNHDPWIPVASHGRCKKKTSLRSPSPAGEILLTNQFTPLDDQEFPARHDSKPDQHLPPTRSLVSPKRHRRTSQSAESATRRDTLHAAVQGMSVVRECSTRLSVPVGQGRGPRFIYGS